MEITEAVIHGLSKESGSKDVSLILRGSLSSVDERMVRLADHSLKKYGKTPSNYGTFDSDSKRYPFPSKLRDYKSNTLSLLELSTETLNLLASKIESSTSASGGYTLFLRYTNQGKSWLLIVMLKLKTGTGIDAQTLDLSDSLSFDIEHLHEAARIDLDKFMADEQPYLSFIKNTKRSDDVTVYFRQALGCTTFTESKYNTEQLLDAIDLYCESEDVTREEKQEIRRKTFEYCHDKKQSGEAIVLRSLSAILNDQEPERVADFIRDSEFQVSENFDPHPNTYARYNRIKGKFGTVSVAFDIGDIRDQIVDYDEDNECLVINNVPISLIEKIQKAKA